MKIAYVIDKISRQGGMERIIIDKLNYLADNTANEVVLLTVWRDDKPDAFPVSSKVRRYNLDVKLPDVPLGFMLGLPWAIRAFNKAIAMISPDVAVFFQAMGAFLVWRTNWTGCRIFESHQPVDTMNHRWVYPKMEKKADCIVCLTSGDAALFRKARKVEVIPNFSTFPYDNTTSAGTRHCIAAGRLCKEKNFSRLIDIWNVVCKAHPDWALDIFGEGEERELLERKIQNYKLNDSIILHGLSTDISREYANSDILLMSSECEGFGLVIVEAARCGVPSVVFDCNYGPRDIIEDCRTGFLIPYNDDEAFAGKLSLLMDDDALRQTMGNAAREASRKYEKEPIMERWQSLFGALANR